MKNILVVNVNWVGDVIFSTAVFKALKTAYPQAKVACLAVPRVREVLESCPYIDEIILYDERGEHSSPLGKLRLIAEIRKHRFDIVFLLHGSLTRALLVFLAGVPIRVGYDLKSRGFLLTHKIIPPKSDIHRLDYYLNVIESYGVSVKERTSELEVIAEAKKNVQALLSARGISDRDFLVVVNCGGNWDLKRWPKGNFALLIERLTKELNAKVVIPGGPTDKPLAQEIAGLSKSNPIILTGETNLKELAALMQRANLVISADTGPLHLANSVGAPVIGIFGPTRPEITGPRGKGLFKVFQKDVGCNRAPCYYLDCPNNVCMQAISADEVVNEARRFKNS